MAAARYPTVSAIAMTTTRPLATEAMAVATAAGTERTPRLRAERMPMLAGDLARLLAPGMLLLSACASDPALTLSGLGLRVSDAAPAEGCLPRSSAQDLVEGAQCQREATDAGTPCTADSQCQGHCELAPDTEPGMPPTGRCSAVAEPRP